METLQSIALLRTEAHGAILYIHGILGTPHHFDSFFPLGEEFSQYSILLDGHGGDARNFAGTSMEKWKAQVSRKVDELLEVHETLYLAAHSMGTLFALSEAIRRPDRIRGVFLWDVPLKIRVRPCLAVNCWKVFRGRIRSEDQEALAAQRAYGISRDYRIWRYLGWIPRYLELFREIRTVRNRIAEVSVPAIAFQSALDEMVSPKAADILRANPRIQVNVLPDSTHFYYPPADMALLLTAFRNFLENPHSDRN